MVGLLLVFALLPGYARSDDQEALTVVTWGGACEASQKADYFDPFTASTGIRIKTVRYDGDVKALRDHLATRQTGMLLI